MPDDRQTPETWTGLNLAALAGQAEALLDTPFDELPDAAGTQEAQGRATRRNTLSAYWEGGTE